MKSIVLLITIISIAAYFFFGRFDSHSPSSGQKKLPSRFSLIDLERVSEPKKQLWGTCWAHAAIASIESNLFSQDSQIQEIDLSEYHMDKFSGFTRKGLPGDRNDTWYSGQGEKYQASNTDSPAHGLVVHLGGTYRVAASYIANLGGVVNELHSSLNDEKKFENFGNGPRDGILKDGPYTKFFPRHIEWLSLKTAPEKLKNTIKENIIKHGAVASAQYMEDEPVGYASDGKEIHLNLQNKKPNHAINIVGWDDNLKFKEHSGAWLVRDSDHKDENDKHIHYFYVPYDDIIVGKDPYMGAIVFRETKAFNFKNIYTHSLHGWRYSTQNNKITAAANKFTSNSDEAITHIGIYTLEKNTSFSLNLYKESLESNQTPLAKGTFKNPGFHLVKLESPFKLQNGEKFYIEQINDRGGYAFDASSFIEVALKLPKWGEPVEVRSKASPNETFIKLGSKWRDFYDYGPSFSKEHKVPKHALTEKTGNIAIYVYTN